ncbi:hypothetical protein K1X76_05560 [bacterium]|nr:hypothetical protein [bacterium]
MRIDSVPDELGGGYTMTEFASNSSNLQANVRGEIPFGFTGTGDSLKVVFGTRNSANEVIIKTVTLVDKDYDVLNTSEGTTLSANIDRFKMSNDGTKLVAIDEDNNTYYYNGTSISSFSLEGITNDSILDMDEYGRYLTYSRQNESLDTMYVSMRDMQEGSNFDLATDLTTIDADEVTSLVLVNQAAVFLVSHDTGSNYNFIFGDFGTSAAGNGDASFDMFYGSTSNISNAKAFDYSGQTTGAYRCFRSEDGDGNSIFGICMIENTSIIDPPDGYTITSFDTSLERNRFIYAIRPAGDSDNTRSQIFIQEIGEDAAYVGPGWSPLFAKTSVNDADTIAYLQYHSSSSTEYPQVAVKDLGLSSSYSTLAARNTFDTIDFGDSANMWREFSGGCWPRTYSIVDDDRSKGTINAVTGYYVAPGSAASVVIKATDCSGTEVSYQSISVEEGGEGQENGGGDSNDTFIAAYFNGDVDNLSGLYFEADEITNSQIAPLISASSIETISFVYNQTIDQSDFTNKFYYENGTQCTLGEIYQPGGTYGIWNPWVDPVDIALGSGNDEWMNGHDNSVTADAITIDGNTYTIDITKAFQSRANGAVDAYEGVNGILSPDDDYTEIVEWTGTGDNRCIRFGQYILGADDLYFQFNDTDL